MICHSSYMALKECGSTESNNQYMQGNDITYS